ncbi:uncharacterized protein LOC126748103 [Anthonomus grandis grandis]|uniref:uncharacterized protein LOC126748103 n=1 Tax=Anthonomus grandis grandis TaxID=2921223 RepID=UPI0021651FCA|nr:uncharacterized protein LOC126748103 [Anthonomus grandis grandis]
MSKGLSDAELERLLYADSDDEIGEFDVILSDDEESGGEPEINDEESDLIECESDSQGTSVEQEQQESMDGGNLFYKSKYGTQWSKVPYPQTRRGAKDIIKNKQGITPYSSNFTTEIEAFLLFMSDNILNILVVQTNRKAEEVIRQWNEKYPHKLQRTWQLTDSMEIKAYLGILLIQGALQATKEPQKILWCTDKKYVRRKINDKLAPIRVFDLFVQNCIMAYSPGSHVTIDEQLGSFRGRCPFRIYMKSKPDKYGLKIWAMADSKNSYSINLQGERVVLDLVDPLGTVYGVTTDNFFTSLPLADKLAEKKLSLCGTLRKNKSYIPNELQPKLFRPEFSSMFAFTKEHTIVSYTPRKGKAVILLSTEHHDDTVADEKYKINPHIILHYNDTKGAVDTTDKMVKQYSARRIYNRWPMAIFGQLLDIAALNSFILWDIKYPKIKKSKDDRRYFLLQLGESLVKEYIVRRYNNSGRLSKTLRQYMRDVVPDLASPPVENQNERLVKSGRCYLCDRNRDRKSRQLCKECQNFVCAEHHVKEVNKNASLCSILEDDYAQYERKYDS